MGFLELLIVALFAWVVYSLYISYFRREGVTNYTEYDENDCLMLAQQNKTNLQSLQDQVAQLNQLKDQVTQLMSLAQSNKDQLSALADQYNNKISVPPDGTA